MNRKTSEQLEVERELHVAAKCMVDAGLCPQLETMPEPERIEIKRQSLADETPG